MLWQSCREGILLAGGLLWPLTCEPPATLGPPSLSVPTGLSVSFSAGLVTQPCNLTETPLFFPLSWTFCPSSSPFSWTFRPSSSPSEFLGGPTVRLLSPSQARVPRTELCPLRGLPFRPCPLAPLPHPGATGAQPAALTPRRPPGPSLLSSTVCSCSVIPAFPPNQHQMSCDISQ